MLDGRLDEPMANNGLHYFELPFASNDPNQIVSKVLHQRLEQIPVDQDICLLRRGTA